ncbi:DMT family transporter [Anaeroselena agilis]|uniref:EamA family transporter n=1 Tax=Anaeroselena agilis TaxID=3063788 RepID=A0ABU3NY81_9FIRM|nr:EamA family transporter [Selenomonadales bacterium 4137-cl]
MGRWACWLIAAAAMLWGIIAVFVKGLAAYGFSPIQVVAVRVAVSAVGLVAYTAAADRKALVVRPADGGYFIGTGIVSIIFFNWCYFTAIETTSVGVAAVLLYTAPAFVAVLSRVVFGERITGRKAAAVAVTFVGCALVAGLLPGFSGAVRPLGLLAGLGAGLGYALYSIFGKLALKRYGALTVTTYTFVFAAAAILPFSGLWDQRALFAAWQVWWYGAGLGVVSTVLAYLLYTVGLKYVEPGRAAVTATLEPLVAAALGAAVFGEALTGWQLAGMALVIAAVAGVQERAG